MYGSCLLTFFNKENEPVKRILETLVYFFRGLSNIFISIILAPIIISFAIFSLISGFKPRKELKFLESAGFVFKRERRPYALKWVKKNVCISLQQNTYKICFNYSDTNPIYVNLFESDIGTLEEKQSLNGSIVSYQSAHLRDKMDNYPDIHTPHVEFIKRNIKEILEKIN